MAEPGFTSVPIEIPTAELARYEKALSKRYELTVTAAHAKAGAAKALGELVLQQELQERAREAKALEPAQ